MPLSKEIRRAKYQKTIDPEPTFCVEAGNSDGTKYYRYTIQRNLDINHFINLTIARQDMDAIKRGKPVPHWQGSAKRGRFFRCTVLRSDLGEVLLRRQGDRPMDEIVTARQHVTIHSNIGDSL